MIKEIAPLLSIINQLILASVLFAASKKQQHNILLGILILLPLFPNVLNLLIFSGNIAPVNYVIYLAVLSNIWYGPVLYFFVQSIFGIPYKFRASHLLHAIPFLYAVFYCIHFALKTPVEQHDYLIALSQGEAKIDLQIWSDILILQTLGYVIYLLITWKKEVQKLAQFYSNENSIRLKWVHFFLWAHLLMIIPAIVIVAFPSAEGFEIVLPILLLILYCYVIYYSINTAPNLQRSIPIAEETKTASKPPLSANNQKILLEELTLQFQNEKIYLKKDLTLNELANVLNVQPYLLSYTINNNLNQTFFDLINSYRIEDAKKKICSPDFYHLTIDGTGLVCGFGSKASFNRAFKKHVGMTPSQFKQYQS